MVSGLFISSGKFPNFSKLKKWTSALFQTGAATRVFGSKPVWAQLKITERCNLNCEYCTEHNNSGNHVPLELVIQWIEHCHKLGVKHLEFIGGEPLMHPCLMHMIKRAKELNINTGLTTNGFLMDETYARHLIDNGVTRLQLSLDCIEPNNISKKAYTLLKTQLQLLSEMDIWVHINSVLFKETISQAYELAELLFDLGIPVAFSPAHNRGILINDSSNDSIIKFLNWLTVMKNRGNPVDMPQFLIDYYRDILIGKPINWTCEGGCKAFYVDNNGSFQTCSHKHSNLKFLDVDDKILKYNHRRKKGCEAECGVSCMIANSLPFSRLDYVLQSDLFSTHHFEKAEMNGCAL